mmetsp:Transcript_58293/g.176258  ORF Transcript_58293/g.176258 Transcript_58293/m.176258 type:complete len:211 (-) Transcript_58293:1051-1683(-)
MSISMEAPDCLWKDWMVSSALAVTGPTNRWSSGETTGTRSPSSSAAGASASTEALGFVTVPGGGRPNPIWGKGLGSSSAFSCGFFSRSGTRRGRTGSRSSSCSRSLAASLASLAGSCRSGAGSLGASASAGGGGRGAPQGRRSPSPAALPRPAGFGAGAGAGGGGGEGGGGEASRCTSRAHAASASWSAKMAAAASKDSAWTSSCAPRGA